MVAGPLPITDYVFGCSMQVRASVVNGDDVEAMMNNDVTTDGYDVTTDGYDVIGAGNVHIASYITCVFMVLLKQFLF